MVAVEAHERSGRVMEVVIAMKWSASRKLNEPVVHPLCPLRVLRVSQRVR